MNHLKHIRGISVRASNAALPSHYRQHTAVQFEIHQLKSQLLWSEPSFATKKNHIKCLRQFRQDSLRLVSKESKIICKQHSKTKSSVTSLKKKSSMHKKLSSKNIVKNVCYYSTCQNVKFNSNEKPFMPQNDRIINNAKNINHSSLVISVEKHPRSYAEMIADYSESLYKESTVGAQNDNFHFNNAIYKSPFSTFSVSPPAKKIVNIAEYSELSIKRKQKNGFPFLIKSIDLCNNINPIECCDFQCHSICTAEAMNKNQSRVITNDLKSDDQSYAKLVADCSKSMHNIPIKILNSPASKMNVLARNSFESVTTSMRKASGTEETSEKVTSTVNTTSFKKNIKEKVINLKENDWLREIENVMSDLKSVTERKATRVVDVSRMKESNILQSTVSGNSLNRIHGLIELTEYNKRQKKDAVIKKLSCQSDKIDRMENRKKDLELQKHSYSQSSDKTSNLSQYFGNTAESSTVRKNSMHVSTNDNTGALKQPQVKLRMVPSEKESVVSINVDQTSFGSLDPLNSVSKHLSVIVQSDQKENLQLTNNQWTPTLQRTIKSDTELQRNDFGPMYISISEDSIPVKQIEFSINGKPVSELKSITARTKRLDVVSSMDKIEIRIPFAKDDSNALNKTRESEVLKGINSNTGQILNVQISANFQDESARDSTKKPAKTIQYQYNKDTIPKSSSLISKTYLSNNFPKVREETLGSNYIQQYQSSKRMNKFDDTKQNTNKHKIPGDIDLKIQHKTMKELSTNKSTGISSIKKINNVEVRNLNMRRTNTTGLPEANKYNENESSDNRVPSKMIPWWSSSDSFNKIRKKENDHKPLMPPSNQNEQKAVPSLNQNFINESLLLKPKETSSSKKIQSINPINNTSDSSNIISYSNSMKPYEESKATFRYACSFRLKPNKRNPDIIPEIIRNDLEIGDNQALTAKKDTNKISEIKQTESIALFRSNTINIKSKFDISTKEKTFMLHKKIKTPNSAQSLTPKKNQEKKNNYSLKQTRSIDNVSKNIKSKIKDILDAIKPNEKRENGILSNYGLEREMSSRKSIARLNIGVKEAQNLSPVITTKNFVPNSPTAKIVSKKIDKTMLTKQTKLTNTEKLKTKMDISLKKKDLIIKNDEIININALNKNNVKNIKEIHKNDFTSSSFSNFKNSSEFTQTLKKQKQLVNDNLIFQDKSKQNLKSLLEANKNEHNSSLNIRVSSGMMQESEKLEISEKIPSEKQNRPKSLTSIKNIPEMIQEFKKLKNMTSSKSANPSKESSDVIMIDKLSFQTIKQIQSKPSRNTNMNKIVNINKLSSLQTISTSKIKDHAVSKNLLIKNVEEMPQSMKIKRTEVGDMIVKIITQNPKSEDSLSKDCEENCFNKSGSAKGHILGSAGPSRKPNDSVDFKSASSMKSKSALFKARQNLNDVDMLEYSVIGSDRSWINMDRPEKSILYSAWLQRSENDIKKNEKLF